MVKVIDKRGDAEILTGEHLRNNGSGEARNAGIVQVKPEDIVVEGRQVLSGNLALTAVFVD